MMLTDYRWEKLLLLMKNTGRIYNKPEHRKTVEGILYRLRTGIPWRDMPPEFGNWSAIFRRFNLWSKKGILKHIFNELSKFADFEWVFLDGSIIRTHQHATGAATDGDEAIGMSRGGNSTKIHLAVDSGGLPVHFELSAGQANDMKHAPALIDGLSSVETIIADKGYDSESLRDYIEEQGGKAVIPRRSYKQLGNSEMDWCLYRYRHLVENAFARIKHFRAISTRYDKLERNYASMVSLAFTLMWLPMYC
jgi:transposase